MIYDIFSFGVALGLIFYTYWYSDINDYEYAAPFIYFGKTAYGFFSLPFLIFKSEIVTNTLT